MASGFWKPGAKLGSGTEDGNVFNFSRASLQVQREALPISKHRRQILYALEKHGVVVIVGETGSGKSTPIPQFLKHGGWTMLRGGKKTRRIVCTQPRRIVCTQPRRIAAINLAGRVAQEQAECGGDGRSVGYAVRFQEQFDPHTTAIKFVTDGMLVREALQDPLLSEYSLVMVDEAHERNLNTDVLLALLKKVRRKRPKLRLIVCSATIDAQAFLDYFLDQQTQQQQTSHTKRKRWGNLNANTDTLNLNSGVIISIDGRQHPVDIFYKAQPTSDYVREALETAVKIHAQHLHNPLSGDILCFLPSAEDIDRAIEMADDALHYYLPHHHMKQNKSQLSFLPLYATLPYAMQATVFQHRKPGDTHPHRRVIFATNMAETSVTVPNIAYVIDSGFVKLPYFDPQNGLERLLLTPTSHNSARQRAGRAGRIGPGTCFRLYTEEDFCNSKIMPQATPPEVTRTNLTSFVLTLKALGVDHFMDFDLMSPPPVDAVCHALETLFALDAIDSQGQLTDMGQVLGEFPSDPRMAKMLLSSLDLHCSHEVLGVAACLQVRSLFLQPRTATQRRDWDVALQEFMDVSGDHVTYVNVLQRVDDEGFTTTSSGKTNLNEEWCKSMFLNHVSLKHALEIRAQLARCLSRYGPIHSLHDTETAQPTPSSDATDLSRSKHIRKCVTAGYFFNVARLANDGRYYTLRGKHLIQMSSSCVLYRHGESSEYILFGETYDGSSGDLEVRSCSVIQGRWLREIAPHYWA